MPLQQLAVRSCRSIARIMSSAALLMCFSSVAAQTSADGSSPRAIHAVSAAGLASAMSYCIARHGPLRQGSEAADCYARSRAILAASALRQRAAEVDARCADPAAFNDCLTPEIGRLVYELNDRFVAAGL